MKEDKSAVIRSSCVLINALTDALKQATLFGSVKECSISTGAEIAMYFEDDMDESPAPGM